MAIEYLKRAEKTAATGEDDIRDLVSGMLKEIEEAVKKRASNSPASLTSGRAASLFLRRISRPPPAKSPTS